VIGHHDRVAKDEHAMPDVIRRYLEAQDRGDTAASLATFAPDAHVLDDGQDYRGLDAIRDWLTKASTQFSYTRTFLDAESERPSLWLVSNRLEGNFPGGVVDLRYVFTLVDGLIADLAIVP
jgi:ketosteroid isomerase-like protein